MFPGVYKLALINTVLLSYLKFTISHIKLSTWLPICNVLCFHRTYGFLNLRKPVIRIAVWTGLLGLLYNLTMFTYSYPFILSNIEFCYLLCTCKINGEWQWEIDSGWGSKINLLFDIFFASFQLIIDWEKTIPPLSYSSR